MSCQEYKLTLVNSTDQPFYYGVYQKFPLSPGLVSVAWQVRGIPPQEGDLPSSAEVEWTMNYGLCIANFDKETRVYKGEQFAPAYLGNEYRVISLDGIPSIDPKPTGVVMADEIVLKNNTGPPAQTLTLGFTICDKIIAVQDKVGGNEKTICRVHHKYYVACYRHIVLGQVVDCTVVLGPVEVNYEGGARTARVVASKDAAGNYHLNVATR